MQELLGLEEDVQELDKAIRTSGASQHGPISCGVVTIHLPGDVFAPPRISSSGICCTTCGICPPLEICPPCSR